jgi:hypothetical protein
MQHTPQLMVEHWMSSGVGGLQQFPHVSTVSPTHRSAPVGRSPLDMHVGASLQWNFRSQQSLQLSVSQYFLPVGALG